MNPKPNYFKVPCNHCNGHYIPRLGKNGFFTGCSKYPNCKSTINLENYLYEFIKLNGVNIYAWKRTCYKCNHETYVLSYFLNYDIEQANNKEFPIENIGIGSLDPIDNYLSKEYDFINLNFSHTLNFSYISNNCGHCNAIQGQNFVVADPHEIMNDLLYGTMDKYFYENIPYEKLNLKIDDLVKIIFKSPLRLHW